MVLAHGEIVHKDQAWVVLDVTLHEVVNDGLTALLVLVCMQTKTEIEFGNLHDEDGCTTDCHRRQGQCCAGRHLVDAGPELTVPPSRHWEIPVNASPGTLLHPH